MEKQTFITNIELDFSDLPKRYPAYCTVFQTSNSLDGICFDNAEECIQFLKQYKEYIFWDVTDMTVTLDGYDLMEENYAVECARKIYSTVQEWMQEKKK